MSKFTSKTKLSLLIFLLSACLSQSVFANTGIQYTPTRVYFSDDDKLIIKGYWSNSGSQERHVKDASLEIYLVEKDGKEDLLAKGNFPKMDVAVPAGDITKGSFTISGVKRTPIGRWHVIAHSHSAR